MCFILLRQLFFLLTVSIYLEMTFVHSAIDKGSIFLNKYRIEFKQ